MKWYSSGLLPEIKRCECLELVQIVSCQGGEAGIDHKSSVFSVAYMGIIRGSVPRLHSQVLSLRGLAFIIKELRHLKNNECIDRIKAFSQCF